MNTQYTRHLSMIRRALSIGTLCLVATFGVAPVSYTHLDVYKRQVVVGANNDVTLTSSNVVSTAGTSVLAGHDVRTDAAAEHTLSTASKDVKKSGIMGAGMGIMIGKKQSKDNYYIDETTHKATTLGSTNGEVTVQAGDTVHLTTTNAVGKNGVIIVGQDILLDGKDDVYKQEERHAVSYTHLPVATTVTPAPAAKTTTTVEPTNCLLYTSIIKAVLILSLCPSLMRMASLMHGSLRVIKCAGDNGIIGCA